MMMNLFAMFDPSTSLNLSMNWLAVFLMYVYSPKIFFKKKMRFQFIISSIINTYVYKDMKNNISKMMMKLLLLFLIIFTMIIFMNLLSIMPFIFTPTAHLSLTLFLAFPFWINLMIKGWTKTPMNMFAHLVPMGSPMILGPFMVIIETISNFIRPMTLSVRLSANLIAGHILLNLLSGLLNMNFEVYYLTSLIMNLLLTLEFSVAAIQSYVFIVLLSLYVNEI